jgi:hypothetical protein
MDLMPGQLGTHVDLNCFLYRKKKFKQSSIKKKHTTEQQGGKGEHNASINRFGLQLFMWGNKQQ